MADKPINGSFVDEGLMALRMAFEDAVYLSPEAEEAAELIMAGRHRELGLPDSYIMEIYGMVTEGKTALVKRTNSEGFGFEAQLTDYTDLVQFIKGELEATYIQPTQQ